jgi:hypothetical protein
MVMAALEERRNKDGAVTYRVKIRREGYPNLSKTFKRKTDAIKFSHQAESEINQGSQLINNEATKKTLADAIDRYIKTILPKKPKSHIKQTAQLYWWKKHIGRLKLAQVSPLVLGEFRDVLLSESTHRGPTRDVVQYFRTTH